MGKWLLGYNRHIRRSPGESSLEDARLSKPGERGCVEPMSTQTSTADKSSADRSKRFVSLTTPAPMTAEKLSQCRDPQRDLEADDGQLVFAVAHQHGIVQQPRSETEYEAMCVLFVTADGEQAVEEWIPATRGEFNRISRVSTATNDVLSSIGDNARRFAPIAREHPEV